MAPKAKQPFDWRPALYVAVAALAIPVFVSVLSAFDLGGIAYFFLIVPVTALIFLVLAIRKGNAAAWSVPVVFCVVSWLCFTNAYAIRTHARWLLGAKTFKAKVLTQPKPAYGRLQHQEWDGWGFAGAGVTNAYLVFDPTDSLRLASGRKIPGKVEGVPCGVSQAIQLEKYWYSLVLYTGTDWDHC